MFKFILYPLPLCFKLTFLLKYFIISIHAPARGASLCFFSYLIGSMLFQFTPLREGLQPCTASWQSWHNFNSRPCERGFLFLPLPSRLVFYFNSRPCERGFTTAQIFGLKNRNFNSRPCERGFKSQYISFSDIDISIHAPARGASQSQTLLRHRVPISIHAPARGASEKVLLKASIMINFNSRPCERGFDF